MADVMLRVHWTPLDAYGRVLEAERLPLATLTAPQGSIELRTIASGVTPETLWFPVGMDARLVWGGGGEWLVESRHPGAEYARWEIVPRGLPRTVDASQRRAREGPLNAGDTLQKICPLGHASGVLGLERVACADTRAPSDPLLVRIPQRRFDELGVLQALWLAVQGPLDEDALGWALRACRAACGAPSARLNTWLRALSVASRMHNAPYAMPPCGCGKWPAWFEQTPSEPEAMARWVEAWLADRRAIGRERARTLTLGCEARGWVRASSDASVAPLRCSRAVWHDARGLRDVAPPPQEELPCAVTQMTVLRDVHVRWSRRPVGDRAWMHMNSGAFDEGPLYPGADVDPSGEGRCATFQGRVSGAPVWVIVLWSDQGERVARMWSGRVMTLASGPVEVDADVWLEGPREDWCCVKAFDADQGTCVVSRRGGATRHIHGRTAHDQTRDVWALGSWRVTLERWPVGAQAQPERDVNTALSALRAALTGGEATARRDVLEALGVCRAAGAGAVASAYLEQHAATPSGGALDAPCPCGSWSRWMTHHLPKAPAAMRDAIDALEQTGSLCGVCRHRVVLDATLAQLEGAKPLVLGCRARIELGDDGRLRARRDLTAEDAPESAGASSQPWWSYVWDVDQGQARLETPDGGVPVRYEGAPHTRLVLHHGQTLELAGVRVLVCTSPLPMQMEVQPPGDGAPHTLQVRYDPFVVGRSPSNDLRLLDRAVARRHAQLGWIDAAWHLFDNGSTNGVFINGKRGGPKTRLREGDVVHIGTHRLVMRGVAGSARSSEDDQG